MPLLSTNTKTRKLAATESGYRGTILNLAPAWEAGIVTSKGKKLSLCTSSVGSCRSACVGFVAGLHEFPKNQQIKREKTLYWWDRPGDFRAQLIHELRAFRHACRVANVHGIVRLNGGTDLAWWGDTHPEQPGKCACIPQEVPELQFVEYTAHAPTKVGFRDSDLPSNVRLTYSRKIATRDHVAAECLELGRPVAIVFTDGASTGPRVPRIRLPQTWSIGGVFAPVVDGDLHDLHSLTAAAQGISNGKYIVGLRAKTNSQARLRDMIRTGFAIVLK